MCVLVELDVIWQKRKKKRKDEYMCVLGWGLKQIVNENQQTMHKIYASSALI